MNIVSLRNPFDLSTKERGENVPFDGSIKMVTSSGDNYIKPSKEIIANKFFNKYKVFLSRSTAEHAGEPDSVGMFKILSRMDILMPREICTDSYLLIGAYDNYEEVKNLYNYLKTKFVRFVVLQSVSSISLSNEKFSLVPLQDFSKPWTDAELYAKYGLTDEEIAFIESMIKPME